MTGLPVQEAARRSPGAGISALQTITAMRRGVLIPYQHQKGELPKTYNQMVKSDRGGLVLQPPVGVFPNVAILDFSSMMASIMIEFNVSPETAGKDEPGALDVPELGVKIAPTPGLMPTALRPLRDKRLALKRLVKSLDPQDPRCRTHAPQIQGRGGRAQMADRGRVRAPGFCQLDLRTHQCPRSGFISFEEGHHPRQNGRGRTGASPCCTCTWTACSFPARRLRSRTFRSLAEEIERETHLPIELQKVYPWFAFLGSRENPNISVANRFYGLAPDGDHKIRGIALRRSDTPAFRGEPADGAPGDPGTGTGSDQTGRISSPRSWKPSQEKLAALKAGEVPLDRTGDRANPQPRAQRIQLLLTRCNGRQTIGDHRQDLKMGQRVRYLHIARGRGHGPGTWRTTSTRGSWMFTLQGTAPAGSARGAATPGCDRRLTEGLAVQPGRLLHAAGPDPFPPGSEPDQSAAVRLDRRGRRDDGPLNSGWRPS